MSSTDPTPAGSGAVLSEDEVLHRVHHEVWLELTCQAEDLAYMRLDHDDLIAMTGSRLQGRVTRIFVEHGPASARLFGIVREVARIGRDTVEAVLDARTPAQRLAVQTDIAERLRVLVDRMTAAQLAGVLTPEGP